jgi:hypothetical protein
LVEETFDVTYFADEVAIVLKLGAESIESFREK